MNTADSLKRTAFADRPVVLLYRCGACPWSGCDPSWSDASEIDPRTAQNLRVHVPICPNPNCLSASVRCERVR